MKPASIKAKGRTGENQMVTPGAVGLPVFSGGGGGLGHLAGPTGGYLIGYLPAVVLIGWIGRGVMLFDVLALLIGTCVIYACGVFWLVAVRGNPPAAALSMGVLPFLPGDALKVAAALSISRLARPLMEKYKK